MYNEQEDNNNCFMRVKLIIEFVMIAVSFIVMSIAVISLSSVSEFLTSYGISSNVTFIVSIIFGLSISTVWSVLGLSAKYPVSSFVLVLLFFSFTLFQILPSTTNY